MKMNIGIVGFGNLGRALASGLLMSGVGAGSIFVCDNSAEARSAAEKDYNAEASGDADEVIRKADIVFLTVKSYVFEELARGFAQEAMNGKIVVSFMAGMPFEKIRPLIGEAELVRGMPSLAIARCEGVIGYTKAPPAVVEIFNALGYAFETDPENIEKVMAFSSCGLGFAAYLADAFATAGLAMGFSPDTSARIAAITFKNAVDRGDFRSTVKAVATPGGATEQGVMYMDECHIYDIVADAVRKAYRRMAGSA